MLVQRQWEDEPELLDAIGEALDELPADEPVRSACVSTEQSEYRDRGYVKLRLADGRSFFLQLWEEV